MNTYTRTNLGGGKRRINKHASREQAEKHGGEIIPSSHKDVRRCQEHFRSQPYGGCGSYKVLTA